MPDAHYQIAKLAELYDLDSPWSADRDFYLSLVRNKSRQSILDLGCGTGLLCDAYAAHDHDVTGVDPSEAMLDVARRKPYGASINWVQSSAQTYQCDKLFDLIIMTGHAFQVLLEDADIHATFTMLRRQLQPGGMSVFESRNPAVDWASGWDYDMSFALPTGTVQESRRFLTMEKDRMKFELTYQFPDETLVSTSELRFLTRKEVEQHLADSGLKAKPVLGDFDGSPFDEGTSPEMIFIVRAI